MFNFRSDISTGTHILCAFAYLCFLGVVQCILQSNNSTWKTILLFGATLAFGVRNYGLFVVSLLEQRFFIGFVGTILSFALLVNDIVSNGAHTSVFNILNYLVSINGIIYELLILFSLAVFLVIAWSGGIDFRGIEIFQTICICYGIFLVAAFVIIQNS